jgi:threonine dehydrogenase-like Zn-dependent dehydrogenase
MSETPHNTILTIPEPGTARLAERPYPKIIPGYALVEIAVAPVCNEAAIFESHRFEWHDSPEHLGHEGVGTIVEVADGNRFDIGDRVLVFQGDPCGHCFVCIEGLSPTHCLSIPYESFEGGFAPQDVPGGLLGIERATGSESGGFGMARYRVAPERMMIRIPDELSFHHAAAGNCSVGANYSFAEEMDIKAGDVVLVAGVGFMGLGAIINAAYRNATVVALGRNAFRMKLARRCGADYVLNPEDPTWLDQLHAIAGDRKGADIAIECSGAKMYIDACLQGLRRYGGLFTEGFVPGGETYPLNALTQLQDRHIRWTGGHDVRVRDREAMVRMLLDPTVQQHIDAMVTHTFPMSEAQEAFEIGLSKQCGKVYLLPQE